jgi:hypothetical protein
VVDEGGRCEGLAAAECLRVDNRGLEGVGFSEPRRNVGLRF